MADPDGHLARCPPPDDKRVEAQPAVENHAQRLTHRTQATHRQLGVVGADGAAADHHGIMGKTHCMYRTPRPLLGDPSAFARSGRNAAIQAGGQLQRDRRQPLGHPAKEPQMRARRVLGADAIGHRDPRRSDPCDPLPCNPRIRVAQSHHQPRDACGNQRIGAGWCLSVMGAGFERDIGRGPPRRLARLPQRHDSAWGRPPGWVQPRPTMRSSLTRTQPTAGLGQVAPSPRCPSASAWRM